MKIKIATTRDDILFCKRALFEFRKNLQEDTFVEQVLRMNNAGFQLIYIANETHTEAAAIAGFRIFEMLRTGTIIYIDDLFSLPENRGKGHASALLNYIHELAAAQGIQTVHLDSGFDLHPAHRLYLQQRYFLACHHFVKVIR